MTFISHEQKARDLLTDARRETTEQARRNMRREALDEAGKIEDPERRDAMIAELRRFRRRFENIEE